MRHRPVLVLELEDRLVFYRRDVPDEQHLYSGTFLLSALARMAQEPVISNYFLFSQGLHVLIGAEWLNTVSNHGTCTIVFSVVTAIVSFIFSLPRTFETLSKVASFSAAFTFLSVLLAMIFSGIEPHPAGYSPEKGNPLYTAIPVAGTTFVSALNAFLNISYTFIGQITLPSFIAEMKEPRDFWKAVTAVTVAEIITFSLVGSIVYVYTGNQYMTSPAFGSLSNDIYKKVSFSFMVPTLIFLGVLYASVSARFVFFRIFDNTRHKGNHTVVGWAAWAAILAVLWVLAFIIASVIPFFNDLLSIMSSLFDSFFGFIFWGTAYIRMRRETYGPYFFMNRGIRGWVGLIVNVFLICVGFFFLGPGTYVSFFSSAFSYFYPLMGPQTSVMSVILSYRAGTVGSPFSCADNGV